MRCRAVSGASSGDGHAAPVTVTRKGVPGDIATFPNGLKDVHAMTAAADALSGLYKGTANSPAAQLTQRELRDEVNPDIGLQERPNSQSRTC